MSVTHPGVLIAPLVLEPAGISQSELARRLGFNQPQPVNELVNGKRGFTPKMALLFEQVTAGRFPALFWLMAQARYDADVARQGVSPGRRFAVEPVADGPDAVTVATGAGCERLLQLTHELLEVDATRTA